MVVKDFSPLPVGGAELQAERLAMFFAKKGLPTKVVTLGASGLPRFERRDGFEVLRVPAFGPGKIKTITFTLGAMFFALKHGKSFDILHAHLEHSAAVAAAIAGKILRKPVIVKFAGSGASSLTRSSRGTVLGSLRLAILRDWTSLSIVLTEEMKDELLSVGYESSKILRLFNGVDSSLFTPAPDKQEAKNAIKMGDKKLVIYVGRLDAIKALPTLLSAFQRALQTHPNLRLLLVGQGDERAALESMAEDLGIQSQLSFLGTLRDVKPYLRAADIFILPSLAEGISNSLLEAMSSGLACIATRVGGSVELLDNGNCGILIDPGNIDQLSAAISTLLSDPQAAARFEEQARRRVLENYDLFALGERYHTLYRQLIEESS